MKQDRIVLFKLKIKENPSVHKTNSSAHGSFRDIDNIFQYNQQNIHNSAYYKNSSDVLN